MVPEGTFKSVIISVSLTTTLEAKLASRYKFKNLKLQSSALRRIIYRVIN
jgi:hypothetical protein